MKTRLFWLLVLCCGLLCMLSLMVVGEEAPARVAQEPADMVMPVTLQPAPSAELAGQVADTQSTRAHAPTPSFSTHAARVDAAGERPYRQHAYYAFHRSDKAG